MQITINVKKKADIPDVVLPTNPHILPKGSVRVDYEDLFLDKKRTRIFNDIDSALDFVKMRAWSKHLYNKFTVTIL